MSNPSDSTKNDRGITSQESTPQSSMRVSPSSEEKSILRALFSISAPLMPDAVRWSDVPTTQGPGPGPQLDKWGMSLGPTVSGGSDFMDLPEEAWASMNSTTESPATEPSQD